MNATSTSRDLVLTLQHRGGFAGISPFVRSLKRTGYRGRVVMFTSRLKRGTLAELRRHGVDPEPFTFIGRRIRQPLARLWPLWHGYFASNASMESKRWLAQRVFHLVYRRYLLYANYLLRHATEFDRVLLADSRDVFFQRDPFCWNPPPGLHVMTEDESIRIGKCRIHRRWMGCLFGEDYVHRHAEHSVSCSGTTFGDASSIRQYLEQMVATTMGVRSLKNKNGDQGVHNYLLIERLLSNVTVHANGHGPVLTMGVMPPAAVRFNADGEVLNADGRPAPVLHQYDRLPDVQNRLFARL